MLKVKGYAKINLLLDVLYKRPDGYHEVSMVMQAVDLADDIYLTEQKTGITVVSNVSGLVSDHTNLAYRAAAVLKDTLGISRGIHIELKKKIPLAAGLAGGSTDAAAVLKGLNQLWNLGLSIDQLAELGAKLGSDVPFCLYSGTMHATGKGEKLARVPSLPECYIVLAKPAIDVSTAGVYQHYQPVAVHPDLDSMLNALSKRDLYSVAANLGNVLETVTVPMHPIINKLKNEMLEYGAIASLMSGSGPTVFGLVKDRQQAIDIAEKLKQIYSVQVFVTKPVDWYGGM